MGRLIPQTLQDLNVFINAKGYIGTISSLKLPDIVQGMVEVKGAIGAKYATGAIKAMEMTFTLKVVDANLFLGLGLNTWKNRIPVIFKGNIMQDGTEKAIYGAVTGDWESVNLGALEAEKEAEVEVKIQAHFFELTVDNLPVILVDHKNMICIIGGVDYLANARANLL
jgi:P2 family phage contractile tail tube protein